VKKVGLTRLTRTQIPRRAGNVSSVDHITGFNPRKGKETAAPGTNPHHLPGKLGGMGVKAKGGLAQHTAPYKHDTSEGNFRWVGPGAGLPV